MFRFATPHPRRKPGLTPLIDVVFLLLVFFMLAAQFGQTTGLPLSGGGQTDAYSGPPRLITILPGAVLLNGQPQPDDSLIPALRALTGSRDDTVVLRARDGANVQRLTTVVDQLTAAGFVRLVLAE